MTYSSESPERFVPCKHRSFMSYLSLVNNGEPIGLTPVTRYVMVNQYSFIIYTNRAKCCFNWLLLKDAKKRNQLFLNAILVKTILNIL